MHQLVDLQQEIPSNKFYAPRVDETSSLFRAELITKTLTSCGHRKKIIVIEAQAGQGKSTLAAQYLHHHRLQFAWYQMGPEDADPVLLLSALVANLCKRLPGFKSPQLSQILHRGEIGPLDIRRCTNILLCDLDRFLTGDFHLVFDDLHLVEDAPLTNSFLDHLLDTSPPHLHFLLTSRRPLVLSSKTLYSSTDLCYLNNDDLSLSAREVEHLFNRVLHRQISNRQAEEIQRRTGGWIMGILLAAYPMAGKRSAGNDPWGSPRSLPASLNARQMLNYFRDEILVHIPATMHEPLLTLSFLDEIPVELAVRITGRQEMGKALTDMVLANFFVYPLDDEHTVFRLHHLFQEFLQYQARTAMEPEAIRRVYRQAAEYYLEKGYTEKALNCYRAEGNLAAVEAILSREGLHLLARNRTVTLLTLLRSIPRDEILCHPWLALFASLVYSEFFPKDILPLLESASVQFARQGEETGELLALAHTIYFHFGVSGLYRTGSRLLMRAEQLFQRQRHRLPVHARIMVARNLAAGYCFFIARMQETRKYVDMARHLATVHNIRNGLASTLFVCGYAESMSGNPTMGLQEVELSFPLLHDPCVSTSNRLILRLLQLNYLTQLGDTLNFERQLNQLQESIEPQVVRQTFAHPFLFIWNCAGRIGRGEPEKGLEVLEQGMRLSPLFTVPHMHSQLLQWRGYIHSLLGNREEARTDIEKAQRLRKMAGGRFYEIFCHIITGATHARLGDNEEALAQLSAGIDQAREMPSNSLLAAGLLHRAWLYLKQENLAAMRQDLARGLSLMERNNLTFFWGWEPGFMRELLPHAMDTDMASFADRLARERLELFLDPDGTPLPLPSISMLGGFRITHGRRILFTANDFTPAQRSMLSLLIASQGHQISQEAIQAELWPNSPPDKARAKLDTLTMRLRKVLAQALPAPAKHYLVMQRGILSLKNCRIDGVEFSLLVRRGLSQARDEKYWQADNTLYRALVLWHGAPDTDDLFSNRMHEYSDQLLNLLTRMGLTWATILARADRTEEAIAVLAKALLFNRMEDRLVSRLRTLYLQAGNMPKARELLAQYRQTLRDQGFAEQEIEELTHRIVSSSP